MWAIKKQLTIFTTSIPDYILWAMVFLLLSGCSGSSSEDESPVAKKPGLASGLTLETSAKAEGVKPAIQHLKKGLKLASEEKLAEAIAEFDQAIAIEPNLIIAYYNRAIAYALAGDSAREEADYRALIKIAERMTEPEGKSKQEYQEPLAAAYYNLALLLVGRSGAEEILVLLNKTLQNAKNVDSYYHDLVRIKELAEVRELNGFSVLLQKYWPDPIQNVMSRKDVQKAIFLRRPPQANDLDPVLHQPPSPPGP